MLQAVLLTPDMAIEMLPLSAHAITMYAGETATAIAIASIRPARYLVLMSDGIFEFLDSQQVMQEVHTAAKAGQSPNEAAKKLVKLARK